MSIGTPFFSRSARRARREAGFDAAKRRHQRLASVHVHPVRAHQACACALLGPVADATDMMSVDEPDDANSVLLGPLDADIHRFLGDDLTVSRTAIDHDHRAIVARYLCMVVTDATARRGVLDIRRHHAHAVAVMAEQVCQDQMIGDQLRFFR